MQEELELMRPLLEEAAKDTSLTMEQIKVGACPAWPGCLTMSEDAQHPRATTRSLAARPLQVAQPLGAISSFSSHLFIQQMFDQDLFCARHCTRQEIR